MIHYGKLRNMASVYIRSEDKLLLLYRQGNSIVSNLWIGSAGGHFEEGEVKDAQQCLLRELYEELTISEASLSNLSLRYVTLRYADGELRQNYYFFAELADPNIYSDTARYQKVAKDTLENEYGLTNVEYFESCEV